MEIERKYLIKQLPQNLCQYENKKIEQGYLCHNPILRIRKSNTEYYMTYKSKFGIKQIAKENSPIVNNEVELPLSPEAYETLKLKIDGNMVYKTRYLIPLGNDLMAEIDIFEGCLKGLAFLEVEFGDEEAANLFCAPPWFGEEVTLDPRFSNYYLSRLSTVEELEI